MGNVGNRMRQGNNDQEFVYQQNGGMYFGDHFVMGGEEFAALDPEAFLFGDMSDLNYLSHAPGAIRVPPNFSHTNTTRCLFYTHKESLKLVQHASGGGADGGPAEPSNEYHLEFMFDSDAPCAVTVHFFCKEVVSPDGSVHVQSKFSWPTRHFGPGLQLLYSHPESSIDLGGVPDDQLLFHLGDSTTYPIIISVVSDEHGPQHALHTYGAFERNAGGALNARQLVQKVTVNGICMVLKEIFGIEREGDDGGEPSSPDPDNLEEDNTECVVCMSSPKDTMVLPCRHMCLCNPCAEVLRFQANKCPICRASYHSLLQIRVLQPKVEGVEVEDDDGEANPPGFSSVALSMAVESAATPQYAPASVAEFVEQVELGETAAMPQSGGAGPASASALASSPKDSGEYVTVEAGEPSVPAADGDSSAVAVGPSAVNEVALQSMLESTFRTRTPPRNS